MLNRSVLAATILVGCLTGTEAAHASFGYFGFSNVTVSWDDFTPTQFSGPVAHSNANSVTFANGIRDAGMLGIAGPNAEVLISGRFTYQLTFDKCEPNQGDMVFFRGGILAGLSSTEFFSPQVLGCSDAAPQTYSTDFTFNHLFSYGGPGWDESPFGVWSEIFATFPVAPIPEPTTYALMLAGLAALAHRHITAGERRSARSA